MIQQLMLPKVIYTQFCPTHCGQCWPIKCKGRLYMICTALFVQRALFIVRCSVTRVTLYTAGHLHTAVPHCSHSRAPIVHIAVLRENNEHGCVYLRCRAVCKLSGCVEGHPCCRKPSLFNNPMSSVNTINHNFQNRTNFIEIISSKYPWYQHCYHNHGNSLYIMK